MSESSRPLGRRELLRASVGTVTAAAVAQPAFAQENATENGTTENGTAENGTTENATTENATAEGAGSEGEGTETAAEDGEPATAAEDGETGAGTISDTPVLPTFAGILAVSLLSPLIFALVMKFVYEDDNPATQPGQHRP